MEKYNEPLCTHRPNSVTVNTGTLKKSINPHIHFCQIILKEIMSFQSYISTVSSIDKDIFLNIRVIYKT